MTGHALRPMSGRSTAVGPVINGTAVVVDELKQGPRTRGPVLFGVSAVALLLGSFGAWSALAPLNSAAIATGVVVAEGERRTVQHLEGGIIREILVEKGQRVKAGDIIIRLDDFQNATIAGMYNTQRLTFLAQDARLEAELTGSPTLSFPDELTGQLIDPRIADAINGQRQLFSARRQTFENQMNGLLHRRAQLEAERTGATAQINSLQQQRRFILEELSGVRDLVRQGLERRPRLLALERAAAQLDGGIADQRAEAERLTRQIDETDAQMRTLTETRKNEALVEQRDTRHRLLEVSEQLRMQQDIQRRREIVAPVDGVILEIHRRTIGAVIQPGEPVLDIVPENERLVVKAQVRPTDVDDVHIGYATEVRLPAFKQRVLPFLHGHVEFIGADAQVDRQTFHSFYEARIAIDVDQLAKYPEVVLQPGMPAEVMIVTGQRTMFDYLVQPIRDSFARAFREG